MGDTLQWVPRDDNEWNDQCEYLRQGGQSIGVVWHAIKNYKGGGDIYRKGKWYYASMKGDALAIEAACQVEAKALCIMLCKLT